MSFDMTRCMIHKLHDGVMSDGTSKTGTEIDVGSAKRGILVIHTDLADTPSDISDVMIYTDEAATITEADTKCSLTKGYYALDSAPTARLALTISSDTFQGLAASATSYVIQVENLQRYVNICYDGQGSTGAFRAFLLTYDFDEAPFDAARSAY